MSTKARWCKGPGEARRPCGWCRASEHTSDQDEAGLWKGRAFGPCHKDKGDRRKRSDWGIIGSLLLSEAPFDIAWRTDRGRARVEQKDSEETPAAVRFKDDGGSDDGEKRGVSHWLEDGVAMETI